MDAESVAAAWRQTLVEIGDMTADFAGRAESIAISGPNRLAVRFRKAYTQALQFCERPERRQKLEQTLSRIAGRTLRIDFGLLAEEAGATTLAEASPPRPAVSRRQRQSELLRHPLIRKASELFDTEIVTVLDAPPQDEPGPALGEGAS
jgi:DNA polymerase III subunit gamma/tau